MTLAEAVVGKIKALPEDKQREVLDFVEFLAEKGTARRPRRSPMGLWSDLGVTITADDIAEARREMWGNFPREAP